MDLWEQATADLGVLVGPRAVCVNDGVDIWLCTRGGWDIAARKLSRKPPYPEAAGVDTSPSAAAYAALVDAVEGTIISATGVSYGSRGARRRLLTVAQKDGLLPAAELARFLPPTH